MCLCAVFRTYAEHSIIKGRPRRRHRHREGGSGADQDRDVRLQELTTTILLLLLLLMMIIMIMIMILIRTIMKECLHFSICACHPGVDQDRDVRLQEQHSKEHVK